MPVNTAPFRKSLLLLAITSLAAFHTTTAGAQAGTGVLEEVVVTAQKRSENLQDVPIAITAFTGQYIEDQNITNLSGFENTIPNVQINRFGNSPDSAVFTIRGVGVSDSDPYVGTTVSVVVDNVVVGVNTAALMSLFDIDRIEVLRGPQGTLFGANTTGGVVNVVTKQPTGEHGGAAEFVVGNYGRIDTNLSIDFPITDSLAGKVSVLHTQNDGFFTNTINGEDFGKTNVTAIRGYLQHIADYYEATLKAEYVLSRNGSQSSVNISDESLALYIPGYTTGDERFRKGHGPDLPDKNDRDTYSLTLTQNFTTDYGDWVSVTNYSEYDQILYSDDDATEEQLVHTRRDINHYQFSQEIRNTISLSERSEMLIGAYGLYQDYEIDHRGRFDGFGRGLGFQQPQAQENWSVSLFSQGYFDLTERLQLQAGIRFTHENTDAISQSAYTSAPEEGDLAGFYDPVTPGTLVTAEGDKSWDNVGYKFGLDYRLNENTLAYGYYARGFKSGGFVGRISLPADFGPFDTEYLDTIEFGLKTDMLDNRVRVNLAAFYNEYEDMQVAQVLTLPNGAHSTTIQNAGEATSHGAELEVTSYVTNNFVLSLAAAYLDSEYKEYDTSLPDPVTFEPTETSLAGNPLMNAPRWSGNISGTYTIPVGPGEAKLFLQATHSSPKYSNFTAYKQELVGDITLLNGRVSWASDSGGWTVGAYGRNLLDKEYFAQKYWFFPTFGLASMGNPRELGVDFKYEW